VSVAAAGRPPRVAFYNNPKVRGAFYQALALVVLIGCAYAFVVNARANLAAQGRASRAIRK